MPFQFKFLSYGETAGCRFKIEQDREDKRESKQIRRGNKDLGKYEAMYVFCSFYENNRKGNLELWSYKNYCGPPFPHKSTGKVKCKTQQLKRVTVKSHTKIITLKKELRYKIS